MRKTLKKILKISLVAVCSLIVLIGVWLLCAWLLPSYKMNAERALREEGVTVFIKSNGVHTDIVVPAQTDIADWKYFFPTSSFEAVDSSSKYLAFGWGDKGFYLDTPTWSDLKFSTAFKAAFWLGTSAMHVTYYKNTPASGERCKRILLSPEEYKKLCLFIMSSFQLSNRKVIPIKHNGYGDDDNFYEGIGTYNFLQTCNEWTGDALEYCGVKIGIWTPLESGIMEDL